MKTTLIYLLFASIAVVSALYLSWPEKTGDVKFKGEKLFEEYEPEFIRQIELVTLNKESNTPDKLTLEKGRDVWTIKEKFGYHASNTPKITNLTACLLDRKIYDAPTDQQSDWEEYGVVDPTNEQAQTPDAYGSRLELKDNNGNTVASLIIGKQVQGNQAQRFVRKPGQPLIYMIDFDVSLLTTDFAEWVDHNILEIKHAGLRRQGKTLKQLEIHSYIIDANSQDAESNENENADENEPQRQDLYQTDFEFTGEKWAHLATRQIDSTGQLVPLSDDKTEQFSMGRLEQLRRLIVILPFTNIQQMQNTVAPVLQKPAIPSDEIEKLQSLKNYGFYPKQDDSGEVRLESSNGHLVVRTLEGVMYKIMFGNIMQDQAAETGLKHWMIVRAQVDQTQFPEIPELGEDATDEQKISYQANVKARKQQLDAAIATADTENKEYSQWLYIVEEQFLNEMRPDLELLFPATSQPNQPAVPQADPDK